MQISKNVSNGFQITNLLATILVISIHYNSKYHIPVYEMGEWNYLFQEYITNGVARIAVPFFAFSSGVFFFLNYSGFIYYKKSLQKRVKSLLVPYLIGCTVVLVTHYFLITYLKGETFYKDFYDMMIRGYLHPVSVQFWFLRDLMILMLISPLILKLTLYSKGVSTLIFGICWMLEIAVTPRFLGWYLINIETLFYFSLGCYLVTSNEKWYRIFEIPGRRIITILLLCFLIMMAIRVSYAPTFNNWKQTGYNTQELILHKTAILIGVYSIICFSSKIQTTKLLYYSSFTFFAYLYHLFPFSKVVTKVGNFIMSDPYLFYFTFPFSTIGIFLIAIMLNKYFNSFYNLLSGSRDPHKIINRT